MHTIKSGARRYGIINLFNMHNSQSFFIHLIFFHRGSLKFKSLDAFPENQSFLSIYMYKNNIQSYIIYTAYLRSADESLFIRPNKLYF